MRLVPIVLCLIMSGGICTAQSSFHELTPGTSTRQDAARMLGQPVRAVSPTIEIYAGPAGIQQIEVEYTAGGMIDRLDVVLQQPVTRSALIQRFNLPAEAIAQKKASDGRLVEYFGLPALVGFTYATGDSSSGIVRIGHYSPLSFAMTSGVPLENKITITLVAGFPNGRTVPGELPAAAVDGDVKTFTWTTEPHNIASPSHLAIGFNSTQVNRLRLWKSANGGGGQNIKSLTIQYTTDAGPLDARSWKTVSRLTNGARGSELLHATSVAANGMVTGDIHESGSGADGWGSLTFDAVTATGLRIAFMNPEVTYGGRCDGSTPSQYCNHYRVAEIEARLSIPPQ